MIDCDVISNEMILIYCKNFFVKIILNENIIPFAKRTAKLCQMRYRVAQVVLSYLDLTDLTMNQAIGRKIRLSVSGRNRLPTPSENPWAVRTVEHIGKENNHKSESEIKQHVHCNAVLASCILFRDGHQIIEALRIPGQAGNHREKYCRDDRNYQYCPLSPKPSALPEPLKCMGMISGRVR